MTFVNIKEAAAALGVSTRHIRRLVDEADVSKKSRWRWGREIIDISPTGSKRRTLRFNLEALAPHAPQSSPGR